MVLYGVPGIGKTSLAANIPGVVFMHDVNEQGIHELKSSGLAPADTPVLPPIANWDDAIGALDALAAGEHSYRCLAIDALGGFERLCHEEVCRRDYSGEWGDRGFGSYQQGYDVSLADIRAFINRLDVLRDKKGMSILLLGHAKVSPFKNPEGPDYDRYNIDIHHKTWAVLNRWAEMVIFCNYVIAFGKDENKAKAKAKGGQARVMHTEHHAAFDAKSKGLPAEIDMGSTGAEAWKNLSEAIKAGKVAQ